MKTLSTAIDSQLYWTQPTMFARHFELHSEKNLLGEIRFETTSAASGTFITAGEVMKRWTFKKTWFRLKPYVTIREAGTKIDLAIYRPQFWGGGWLEFVSGSRYHWKSTSFWGTKWGFSNAQEELLFVLKPKLLDLLKVQSIVEIGTQWHDLEELPLLLLLGWYLKVRDSYAAW
ncbi:MAG: hypothetical protein Q7U64_01180 [Desulfocapsaceae bacterium]|jgi:hypothetical protein|nr:hypothetical protein [Desulfocapsaceae bacterium]